ncbi:hypothetical protein [Chryseobacterium cheonjiense]|uniref:Uncharacterized protein n=1 Tax=Chryseobacterium cheonjiense TaxID=2728845 RepID=A0A7Y0FHJ6_9FLAO|nr:hypothetical protein [Chryseobacterium cheonjiense]NML56379.1 hypothetical protein [Chryseobacterium cheonjiense]
MKKFILLFFGVLLFDIVYTFLYDQFFIGIQPEFLQYPLIAVQYMACAPAIFFDKLLPFYAPIPMYQSILIFLGNVFVQTLLVYTIFFKRKKVIQEE